MRILVTLLALAAAEVLPAIALADPPLKADSAGKPSLVSHGGDLAGRFNYESTLPYAPSVGLELRASAGHDDALLGPLPSFYRTQPEVHFGFQPAAHLSVFAGGGVGAAYVVAPNNAPPVRCTGPALSFSGALGARLPLDRVALTGLARAESVTGYGTAVTFNLALGLAEAR